MNLETKGLYEKKGKAYDSAKIIMDLASDEDRGFTKEENVKVDKFLDEITSIDKSIESIEKLAAIDKTINQEIEEKAEVISKSSQEIVAQEKEYEVAYVDFLRKGSKAKSENLEILDKGQRTMSTTTGSEGGFTIPTTLEREIMVALRELGSVRNIARVTTTSTGNPIDIVTSDFTDDIGEWLAENTETTTEDTSFSKVTLSSFIASSKKILVPWALLEDEETDLLQHLQDIFLFRLNHLTNTGYTTGNGTGKPTGFVGSAHVGVTTAAEEVFTSNEVIDLFHSLDPSYRIGATWTMNDTTAKALRKIKDDNGQYLWQPGLQADIPDIILSRPVSINQQMADQAEASKFMAFGNFDWYRIRDVKGLIMRRSDERHIESLQTVFLAFLRTEGKLIAPNTTTYNPIKVMQSADT